MNDEQKDKRTDPDPTIMFRAGVWKRVGKTSGNPYLGGTFENYWINIFNNKQEDADDPRAPTAFLKLKRKEQVASSDPIQSGDVTVNLYKKTSKKGNHYLGGIRDNIRYHLYAIKTKKSPKSPDYMLVAYDLNKEVPNVYEKPTVLNPPEIDQMASEDPWELSDEETDEQLPINI